MSMNTTNLGKYLRYQTPKKSLGEEKEMLKDQIHASLMNIWT